MPTVRFWLLLLHFASNEKNLQIALAFAKRNRYICSVSLPSELPDGLLNSTIPHNLPVLWAQNFATVAIVHASVRLPP
jgi:hypothetical protein